jgi:hypothetical protein
VTLDDVRDLLMDTSGLPPQQKELVEVLAKNVFVFDLLNQGDESWLQVRFEAAPWATPRAACSHGGCPRAKHLAWPAPRAVAMGH